MKRQSRSRLASATTRLLLALFLLPMVAACTVKAPDVKVDGDVKVNHELSLGESQTVNDIKSLYDEIFGREPTEGEVDYWSEILDLGKMSLAQIKEQLAKIKSLMDDDEED